jgi:hypothetical protein
MKIRQFLEHHGLQENPFADEDAQTDLIFKGHCIQTTYHPTWDKIYGNPGEPATAVVFGEKGAGKTAMRLQIARHLADFNADHPQARAFVIQYDDFNPFLDRFRGRFGRRRMDRVLSQWRIWDHLDAILSLGVTQLVDRILKTQSSGPAMTWDAQPLPVESLDRVQARDLLLLAACYDRSTGENRQARWNRLRRTLRYPNWTSHWDVAIGSVATVAVFAVTLALGGWQWLGTLWPWLAIAAGWAPRAARFVAWQWRAWRVARNARALDLDAAQLRRILMGFPPGQLAGQPLPNHPRTDDRYELLSKFQNLLRTLGFGGTVVLVDRVDEPYLINGSPELMRALIWPLLDNKLLKHPGLGFKLLLPAELLAYLDREERPFHDRARLDKQNLVRSLEWTGQSLYDLANARLQASAADGRATTLADWFDDSIDEARLIRSLRSLRVPRNLFKFLYRLLVTHTNAHTDQAPVWKISGETFETVLALYERDQAAFERGAGVV